MASLFPPGVSPELFAGTVAAVAAVLIFAWIFSLIIEKKEREEFMDRYARVPWRSRQEESGIFGREMDAIWIGRMGEFAAAARGRNVVVDGEHYLSLYIWGLTLAGLAGCIGGWYPWQWLALLLICIFSGTMAYAGWRHNLRSNGE